MKRKETIKDSSKKRFQFRFFKKHRALSVSLIIILAGIGSFLVVNYGRYVKNIIEVYYLRTKNFYFSSDKLTINGKTYEINPWSGVGEYPITINLSSMLNSLKGTTSDITYDVSCTADANSTCKISDGVAADRTLPATTHEGSFIVNVAVKTGVTLKSGDVITIKITADATAPYKETLTATYKFVIGNYGVNYTIEDENNRLYLDSIITNTQADKIVRAQLTISDLSLLSFDMTNSILNDSRTTITDTSTTDGDVKTITFYVDPKSSMKVRYYKKNPKENYTFNGGDGAAVKFTCLEGCEDD